MNQSTAIQKAQDKDKILEQVIIKGDVSDLTPEQRVSYHNALCHSLKLNPLSKPFDFLELYDKQTGKTKVIIYANKGCAAQLKTNHQVSVWKTESKIEDGCLIVTAYAKTPDGREDIDEGAVYIKGLVGDSLCNARMKAITKAKRRVTLSICGLGFLDESEIDSIPGAQAITHPEQDAVMTASEAEQLILAHKSIPLDQWQCGRALAMKLITVCKLLEAQCATEDIWHSWLPSGITTRKDLTEEQAQQTFDNFQKRLESIKNAELDKWQCSPGLAIRLMDVCGHLAGKGVDTTTMKERLGGVQSLKDLTEEKATEALKTFTHWLSTYNQVVEGGTSNG